MKTEELRAKIKTLMDELWAIEAVEKRQTTAAIIGRCFKYENRYSGGETWWLYGKVTRSDEGGMPYAWTFEKCVDGRIGVKFDDWMSNLSSWSEIPKAEFDAAWAALMTHLAEQSATLRG